MIANPTVPAFRYDPYSKKFTRETYQHQEMKTVRGDAVKAARKGLEGGGAGKWAVTLGTLGRQGSLSVLKVGQVIPVLYDTSQLKFCRPYRRRYLPRRIHHICCYSPKCHRRSSHCFPPTTYQPLSRPLAHDCRSIGVTLSPDHCLVHTRPVLRSVESEAGRDWI